MSTLPRTAHRTLLAGAATALAAASFALPEDRQQPIQIQADESSFDAESGVSTLTGAVQIDQGTLRIMAETVTVTDDNGRLVRIVAQGEPASPATYRQRLNVGEPLVYAEAQEIDYAVGEERIELRGQALLTQADREFAGEAIFYDIKEGRVTARSEQPGGVRFKWQPKPPATAD